MIKANQAKFSIRRMCRLIGVSHSGFYAWKSRKESKRDQMNRMLSIKILEFYDRSHGTYGAIRIFRDFLDLGTKVSKNRIARLMKKLQIAGVTRRKWMMTTKRDDRFRPAPDLVNRNFAASKPNQLWVADITYIPTWEGFLYLAAKLWVGAWLLICGLNWCYQH